MVWGTLKLPFSARPHVLLIVFSCTFRAWARFLDNQRLLLCYLMMRLPLWSFLVWHTWRVKVCFLPCGARAKIAEVRQYHSLQNEHGQNTHYWHTWNMLPGKLFVTRIALSWWMKVRVLNNTPGYRRSSVLEDFLVPSLIWCYSHRLFIHSLFFWWLNHHVRLLLILKPSKTIIVHCLLMLKASFLMIHLEFQSVTNQNWGPSNKDMMTEGTKPDLFFKELRCVYIYNYIYIYRYYIHRYSIYLVAHPTNRK